MERPQAFVLLCIGSLFFLSGCASAGSGGEENDTGIETSGTDDADLDAGESPDIADPQQDLLNAPEDTVVVADEKTPEAEIKTPEPDSKKPDDSEPETYLGGWVKADCADQIKGSGNKAGQIAHDFVQMDQFGDMLRLYDFCDRHVLLVGSAWW